MSLPGFIPSMVLVLNTGSCSHQALQPCPSSHMPVPCHTGLLDHTRQFSSVTQSCLTLCNPMDCRTPGLPTITNPQSLLKLMSIKLMKPSNHLILCCPLLLSSSIFPSIRVFSNESVLSSGGQSIGVSASASVLPMNIQD